MWDFLAFDHSRFAPKGRFDASIHEIPNLMNATIFDRNLFSATRSSQSPNFNSINTENLSVVSVVSGVTNPSASFEEALTKKQTKSVYVHLYDDSSTSTQNINLRTLKK